MHNAPGHQLGQNQHVTVTINFTSDTAADIFMSYFPIFDGDAFSYTSWENKLYLRSIGLLFGRSSHQGLELQLEKQKSSNLDDGKQKEQENHFSIISSADRSSSYVQTDVDKILRDEYRRGLPSTDEDHASFRSDEDIASTTEIAHGKLRATKLLVKLT